MRTVYVYLHPQGLANGEISLFGVERREINFRPASIKDLRHNLARQLRLVELNVHPDGRVYPWGENEIVVVQEGAFIWKLKQLIGGNINLKVLTKSQHLSSWH
ncbi:hypothetical protein [Paenibacillus piri]|uniref:Uncharacterized protein n=1 Tax=Paenibacillus piri TaxID=2547395 RepID=A0A4R5KXW7_9BACL|nr:hypothetical protein [Paenibacillus piri]TDG00904.1 hypothetical protein E1757_04645 [Paenibacillus piri]